MDDKTPILRQRTIGVLPVWRGISDIRANLPCLHGIGQEHGNGHGANAAGHGGNGRAFFGSGGEIHITAYTEDPWFVIVFRDSGPGMTPEIQQHIFDKFYQGDTSHKNKGNGLGLALVHKIVTLYGGAIQLESVPGMGSTFKILLPLSSSS